MRLDENDVLVSEIYPDDTGFIPNRGDSMANTSRWVHLETILRISATHHQLAQFVSPTGYLRHPSKIMPKDWCESDSSTDQCLPFYIAARYDESQQMYDRIKAAGWRTGNGDLISPLFYAILNNSQWKIDLCILGQIALFSIPYRWSDSKKWFESSKDSSADFLNWFHCLPLASSWVKKLINKNHVRAKIQMYFFGEPRVYWLLDLYDKAIEKVLG